NAASERVQKAFPFPPTIEARIRQAIHAATDLSSSHFDAALHKRYLCLNLSKAAESAHRRLRIF
ncbi:MAG: hypothetical protein II395_01830, partial [Ruminococcus sp.]|nr:hypothetical protein [Ruminococcus sp.]